jgi:hypothetical protein
VWGKEEGGGARDGGGGGAQGCVSGDGWRATVPDGRLALVVAAGPYVELGLEFWWGFVAGIDRGGLGGSSGRRGGGGIASATGGGRGRKGGEEAKEEEQERRQRMRTNWRTRSG